MNKKGANMDNVGVIFGVFMAVIVGLVIMTGGILPNIGATTLTASTTNATFELSTTANTTTNFPTNVVTVTGTPVYSTSEYCHLNSSVNVAAANFTVLTRQVIDGASRSTIQITDTGLNANCLFNTTAFGADADLVNVTYDFEPTGYIRNSGARSITTLIAVFVALVVLITAIIPSARMGLMNMFGR